MITSADIQPVYDALTGANKTLEDFDSRGESVQHRVAVGQIAVSDESGMGTQSYTAEVFITVYSRNDTLKALDLLDQVMTDLKPLRHLKFVGTSELEVDSESHSHTHAMMTATFILTAC